MLAKWRTDRAKLDAACQAIGRQVGPICGESPNWQQDDGQASRLHKRLADLADTSIRQIAVGGESVACRKGCDHCCYAPITCTWPEAKAIADEVTNSWDPAELQALKQRLTAYCKELGKQLLEGGVRFRGACPFLKDSACSIYEIRPLLCRGLTSWDADLCLAWKEECQPSYVILSPNGESVIATTMQQAVAAATGNPNGILPMALALAHLLGASPKPPERGPGFVRKLGEHRVKPDAAITNFEFERVKIDIGKALKSLEPWNPVRGIAGLFVPDAYREEAEIDESFERLDRAIERLENADFGPFKRDVYDVLEIPRFVIYGYAGRPLREVMTRIGRLFEDKIARPLAPDLLEPMPARKPGRLRVGFMSFHLRNSNAANWSLGWLKNLNRAEFETFAIKIVNDPDSFTFRFKDAAEHFMILDGDRIQAARYVRSLDLDYLIYPVLGDEGQNHQFALFRLARRQATGWGCPFTSGMPQIDDYLSSELTEPPDGDSHYSEKLVRLPGNGLTYSRFPDLLLHRGRSDFGLPEGHLVGLTQNLSKWLPRHDPMLAELSNRLENPLHVAEFGTPYAIETFKDRMAKAGARISYLPLHDVPVFLRMGGLFDVSLDAPEWHGGHSSFSTLQYGAVPLSLLGSEQRARMALGFQPRAGIPDAVVETSEEYVRRATDPNWAAEQHSKIDASPLFEDIRPVRALQDWIRNNV